MEMLAADLVALVSWIMHWLSAFASEAVTKSGGSWFAD